MRKKLSNGPKLQRYAWWLFILYNYNYTIERVQETTHHLPDALTQEMKMMCTSAAAWQQFSTNIMQEDRTSIFQRKLNR